MTYPLDIRMEDPELLLPGRKPIGPCTVDREHRFGRNSFMVWTGGKDTVDYTHRATLNGVGSSFNHKGDYVSGNGTGDYADFSPLIEFPADSKFTILLRFTPPSYSATYRYVLGFGQHGDNPLFSIRYHSSFGASAVIEGSTSGQVDGAASGASTMAADTPVTIGVAVDMLDADDMRLYLDGNLEVTTSITAITGTVGGLNSWVCNLPTIGSNVSNGILHWMTIHKGEAFNTREMAELTHDPFCYLIPE